MWMESHADELTRSRNLAMPIYLFSTDRSFKRSYSQKDTRRMGPLFALSRLFLFSSVYLCPWSRKMRSPKSDNSKPTRTDLAAVRMKARPGRKKIFPGIFTAVCEMTRLSSDDVTTWYFYAIGIYAADVLYWVQVYGTSDTCVCRTLL